jgi:hypothetical protein
MKYTDFFFCYNKKLFSYLRDTKGIDYITVAQNPTTKKIFAMFYKNDDLQKAINDYKQHN